MNKADTITDCSIKNANWILQQLSLSVDLAHFYILDNSWANMHDVASFIMFISGLAALHTGAVSTVHFITRFMPYPHDSAGGNDFEQSEDRRLE